MNRLAHPFRCLLLALAWVLLSPVQPQLHAHAMGGGSADSVSGLHAPWVHDAPGPADQEFIAEVEDLRKLSPALLPALVSPCWRLSENTRPQAATPAWPLPHAPPPRHTTRHPQAP